MDGGRNERVPGAGRAARNGLNFTERGFGVRGAIGVSDRGHTATAQLQPCAPGQERNPDTNRCRKTSSLSSALPVVKDVRTEESESTTGWYVAGVAAAIALGYGVYEWRADIVQRLRRLSLPKR